MPKSKYKFIYNDLKKEIESGKYQFSEILPSENHLVQTFDCTRNTVRRALADLAQEGYIQPIHGKGVRVIYQPTNKAKFQIGGVETFEETGKRNNIEVKTKVLDFEEITIDEKLSKKTNLPSGAQAYFIKRVRYLDGKPLIIDTSYYIKELTQDLSVSIAEKSIYDYLEKEVGLKITQAKRIFRVKEAKESDKKLIDLDGLNCIVSVTNEVFDSYGYLFEWTESRHNPNYFQFETIAKRTPIE